MPLGAWWRGCWVRTLGMPRVIGAYCVGVALLAAGTLAWNRRIRSL